MRLQRKRWLSCNWCKQKSIASKNQITGNDSWSLLKRTLRCYQWLLRRGTRPRSWSSFKRSQFRVARNLVRQIGLHQKIALVVKQGTRRQERHRYDLVVLVLCQRPEQHYQIWVVSCQCSYEGCRFDGLLNLQIEGCYDRKDMC